MSDFYVGYQPQAPQSIGRVMRRSVVLLLLIILGLAVVFISTQAPFAAANFEFDNVRKYRGIIEEYPVPVLRVALPGGEESRYPLVAPGKHGTAQLLLGLHDKEVEFDGMLIYRQGATLVEVMPGTINIGTVSGSRPAPPVDELGLRTIIGEIVDTKCYAGVMNPGQGKVHRDCAARCISGGITAALLSEGTLYYLIVDGKPAPSELLHDYISRPVALTGSVSRRGDTLYLALEPRGIACARELLKQ